MSELNHQLNHLFGNWDGAPKQPLLHKLPKLFDALRKTGLGKNTEQEPASKSYLGDGERLRHWFSTMHEPLAAAKRSGLFCDPWRIAGLKRDEVRNSGVLAWLLAPNGSHGKGSLFIDALLWEIQHKHPSLMTKSVSGPWSVHTEVSPDGDSSNRVDILLSCESHFIVIEVKIGAGESNLQLARYAEMACNQAGHRQWCIIFLTTTANLPSTAGEWKDYVIPISWKRLSLFLKRALRLKVGRQQASYCAEEKFTQLLVERFFSHVRNF